MITGSDQAPVCPKPTGSKAHICFQQKACGLSAYFHKSSLGPGEGSLNSLCFMLNYGSKVPQNRSYMSRSGVPFAGKAASLPRARWYRMLWTSCFLGMSRCCPLVSEHWWDTSSKEAQVDRLVILIPGVTGQSVHLLALKSSLLPSASPHRWPGPAHQSRASLG